ncbi:hypothetical protein VZT92_022470 [Zoarces viviparus]|uniref:Uncharacterized protein n=1 Tax=Zoarces viviparus TaxID=48416 RepID=A0AAW1ECC2_ZOAVI
MEEQPTEAELRKYTCSDDGGEERTLFSHSSTTSWDNQESQRRENQSSDALIRSQTKETATPSPAVHFLLCGVFSFVFLNISWNDSEAAKWNIPEALGFTSLVHFDLKPSLVLTPIACPGMLFKEPVQVFSTGDSFEEKTRLVELSTDLGNEPRGLL